MYYEEVGKQLRSKYSEDVKKFSAEVEHKIDHFSFAYKAIHTAQEPEQIHGSIAPTLHMTTTFAQKSVGVFYSEFDYARCGNPTRDMLCKNLADLEYAKYCQVFSSGVAALSAFISMFKSGEHIICCDDVYGGTQRLLRHIAIQNYALQVSFVDLTNLIEVEESIKPNTKCIWIETPTNPTLKVCDIKKICSIAKQNNIITVVDNTFCSPVLQSPLLLGADFVTNSCTKYIGGHADILMGSMSTNSKVLIFIQELNDRLYFNVKSMGGVPSPFECYLCLRSLKTLKIRMEAHCKNAMAIAKYLDQHPLVEKVIYPGLKSHPQYEIIIQQQRDFGGMITFYIKGGLEQSKRFSENVKVFILAESLGGVESLTEIPSLMTHGSVPIDQRKKLGIEDNLIRLSVGIEDVENLLEDLEYALRASQ